MGDNTPSSTRLDRAKRAQSTMSLTPLGTTDDGNALLLSTTDDSPLLATRSFSYGNLPSQAYETLYNSRGFDVVDDPFTALVGANVAMHQADATARPSPTVRSTAVFRTPSGAGHKRASSCRVGNGDELWTRFGARAAAFGGWNEGHERIAEFSSRWGDGAASGKARSSGDSDSDDDDSEDGHSQYEDSRDARGFRRDEATNIPTPPDYTQRRPSYGPDARSKSSLSVFHDAFEEVQDSFVLSPQPSIYSSPTTSPSVSRAHSRYQSLSSFSPLSSSAPLNSPQTPATSIGSPVSPTQELIKDEGIIDALTHQFLQTQQDSFGLFARVEAWLEWPWASSAAKDAAEQQQQYTASPSTRSGKGTPFMTPAGRTPDLSRVPSLYSMNGTTPPTPDLDHSTWSEIGELASYRRARSMVELSSKLEWEEKERRRKEEGDEKERESRHVRDGLAACADVLAGLGGFF
ncbi:hypothetical protein T439DRAFT_323393 [Meredithblackwellia eburnea MCA 4105]